MDKFRKIRTVLTICVALGWWGVWFPELVVWTEAVCVVEDTGKQVSVQSSENVVECDSAQKICEGLMNADKGQIQIKSRLLMLFTQYMENNRN